MKLSCTNSMLPPGTLTEKARLLKAWGYDGISIFLNYGDWNDALYEEVLTLEERTGIAVSEFAFEGAEHGHGHLMDCDPVVRKKAREMYKAAAAVCARLGAVTEVEYEYQAQYPIPMLNPYARMSPQEEAEFLDMYREVAQAVQGSAAYLLIEPINRYESPYLNCVSHALETVKKLNMPNTGLLPDVFHMSIEERSIADSLRAAKGYIYHVHLGDNNRLLPGEGNINWREVIGALKEIGYDRYLNLECAPGDDPATSLPRTAEYLRSLL